MHAETRNRRLSSVFFIKFLALIFETFYPRFGQTAQELTCHTSDDVAVELQSLFG